MPKYLVLIKINPPQTDAAIRALRDFPDKPWGGVTLHYTMNVFGPWDLCMWFNADTHEQAMDFVNNKIRTIPGVTEVYVLPTTPIKQYLSY